MKKTVLCVVAAACGVVVLMLNSPARVNVVTGATPANPTRVLPPGDAARPGMMTYFYKVTHTDGTVSIEEMPELSVQMFENEMKAGYDETRKAWAEQKKKWARIMHGEKFPMLPAMEPKCQRIAKVPEDEDKREALFAKIQERLSVWDVCLLSDAYGQREVAVIRHDEVYARWQSMAQQYCDAALAAKSHAAGPNGRTDTEPVLQVTKPALKLIKSKFPSREKAEEFAQAVRKKLDEREAAKYREQAPPTEEAEPDADDAPADEGAVLDN